MRLFSHASQSENRNYHGTLFEVFLFSSYRSQPANAKYTRRTNEQIFPIYTRIRAYQHASRNMTKWIDNNNRNQLFSSFFSSSSIQKVQQSYNQD